MALFEGEFDKLFSKYGLVIYAIKRGRYRTVKELIDDRDPYDRYFWVVTDEDDDCITKIKECSVETIVRYMVNRKGFVRLYEQHYIER